MFPNYKDKLRNHKAEAETKVRVRPFTWRHSAISQSIEINELKVTVYASDCMAPEGSVINKEQPAELSGKYLQLPQLFGGYVISCFDLFMHVHDWYWKGLLESDIKNRSPHASCTFWNTNGERIGKDEIDKSRLGVVLRRLCTEWTNSGAILSAYREEWVLCMNFATSFSSQHAPAYSRNPFSRFYVLEQQLPIFILLDASARDDPATQHRMRTAIKEAQASDPNVKPSLINTSHVRTNKYVQLSTNPLGFYSTWVERTHLETLVSWQTGKYTWAESPPKAKELKSYHKGKLKGGTGIWKQDSMQSTRTFSLLQWPGQAIQYYKRRSTESVMGSSANKWATMVLGWDKDSPRSHRAEWLHMIAHRFEPNTGDRYSNLIFGTKECNTDMMRAEAAVEQLLFSGKVSAVGIEVTVQHNLSSVRITDCTSNDTFKTEIKSTWADLVGRYPKWLALKVGYSIHYYLPNEKEAKKTTTYFYPFSTQCPLYFEYTLDRIYLSKLLNSYTNEVESGYESIFTQLYQEPIWSAQPQKLLFSIDDDDEDDDTDYHPNDQKEIEEEDTMFQAEYEEEKDMSIESEEEDQAPEVSVELIEVFDKGRGRTVGLAVPADQIQKLKHKTTKAGRVKKAQKVLGASDNRINTESKKITKW